MIKRLLNYIRREDEIKRLKIEVRGHQYQINRMVEINANEFSRLTHSILALQNREGKIMEAVIELQEKNIYEH